MFNFKKYLKSYQFQSRNLTLTLEQGWIEYKIKNDEPSVLPLTFVKEKDGVGALQVSLATAQHGEKFDINEILKNNHIEPSSEIKEYKLYDLTVYEYEVDDGQRYVKYFNLIKLNVIVLATYNCELNNLNKKELSEAIKIIKTIRVISNN
jgi:hypothetical protein